MHNQQISIERLLEYTFPRGRANNPRMRGDVGKLRQTANGTVSGGVEKRAAAAQMFSPELAQVGKDTVEWEVSGGGTPLHRRSQKQQHISSCYFTLLAYNL